MRRFRKIVTVGLPMLPPEIQARINHLAANPVTVISDEQLNPSALSPELRSADALLVSLHTDVPASLIRELAELTYIGVLGTSQGRIDAAESNTRNITVTSVPSYCDWETAEFVLGEMLCVARGLRGPMWASEPRSLAGKRLGILGMGKVGSELVSMALALGMQVSYHSRTRKPEIDLRGVHYLDRATLLSESEFVSVHLPAHLRGFHREDFDSLRTDAVWINTSMGDVFDPEDLQRWLESTQGIAVLDRLAGRQAGAFRHERLVISERQAYWTTESINRLHEVFVSNVESFLQR